MTKFILGVLFPLMAATSSAACYTSRVVAISDGDTITVLDAGNHQHKVSRFGK